jgi:hypothetical protein
MVRPDFEKWSQSAEDIRRLSIEAEHPRSRERFQALYMIGSGQENARADKKMRATGPKASSGKNRPC